MKTLTLLLQLFPLSISCQTQVPRIIARDSTVNLFEVLFKLDEKYLAAEYPDGDFFYRALALPLTEAESNLEGELLYRIYILKGEYGEYPEGKLFDAGKFYNITKMVIEPNLNIALLKISHGIKGEIDVFLIE